MYKFYSGVQIVRSGLTPVRVRMRGNGRRHGRRRAVGICGRGAERERFHDETAQTLWQTRNSAPRIPYDRRPGKRWCERGARSGGLRNECRRTPESPERGGNGSRENPAFTIRSADQLRPGRGSCVAASPGFPGIWPEPVPDAGSSGRGVSQSPSSPSGPMGTPTSWRSRSLTVCRRRRNWARSR